MRYLNFLNQDLMNDLLRIICIGFKSKQDAISVRYILSFCLFFLPSAINMVYGQDKELKPFVVDHRNAGPTAFDISGILEKPAGKQGFVQIKNGQFFKPNGERLKLWGVNITDWTRGSVQIPSKEESTFWAKTLARYGVNCVRLTFLDFFTPRGLISSGTNNSRELDAAQLDKLDYWISELKKNGIYTDLNLLVGRTFREGDSVQDHKSIGWAKYVSYFDPQLIRLQKEFARKLLTHYNPYTKTEYRNEPAIILVELVNENTLFDAWHRDALHPTSTISRDPNFKNLTAFHSNQLTVLFNEHIKQTHSPAQQELLREQAGVAPDSLIPRIRKAQYETAPKELYQATVNFYTKVEKDFFADMYAFTKDTIKVRAHILGSNDFLHNQSEYPMVISNSVLDVQDGHVYWQHPSWPGKLNTPMVDEPDSSTVVKLSRTAMAGMPYIVSEVNHAFPNDFECEGIPIIAAYASLQDWDAIMWYTFEPKSDPAFKGYVGDAFDISMHPVKLAQLAAGALLFLRSDVEAAKQLVKRNYTTEHINETLRMGVEQSSYYTPGFDVSTVLKHRTRIGSMDANTVGKFENSRDSVIISDTNELKWFSGQPRHGLVVTNTPRSQALVGFTGKHPIVGTQNLAVNVKNEFCAITLSSLNNRSISTSSRLLLTTGALVENTGMTWNELRTKGARRGQSPSLIEVVKGKITLKNLSAAKRVTVRPLGTSGNPEKTVIQALRAGKVWTFNVGDIVTPWYEIVVER